MSQDKKNNVVGIGHNNQYGKEQYARLVNTMHKVLNYARGMTSEVEHKFDEAFTKHENGRSWSRKLKDFEIHERRLKAKNLSNRCYTEINKHIEALEEKAKANNIELELNKEEESNG